MLPTLLPSSLLALLSIVLYEPVRELKAVCLALIEFVPGFPKLEVRAWVITIVAATQDSLLS